MNLLTKEDFCAKFKVSHRTVDNWISSGIVPPPSHIGRKVYWAEPVIDAWLNQITNTQPTQDLNVYSVEKKRRRGRPRKSDFTRKAKGSKK